MTTRTSAFRGTWQPNRRPYLVLAPDVFISIQGETSVIGCGECRREINLNKYLTAVTTNAAVDAVPGDASIALSIPDNDINNFFINGQFLVSPMMEIEVYSKGYYTIGGFPQYYRIFWGLISSVTRAWSNGVTTININCKDILRWWQLTNITINPAFTESIGTSAGTHQLFKNQFAGQNPYTVITRLAQESWGDFSLTTGSFNQNFRPEKGDESRVIGDFTKDIMAYWQLKFSNIWNNLVLFGSSGQAYVFNQTDRNVKAGALTNRIFAEEARLNKINNQTSSFQLQPNELAAYKKEIAKAGDIELTQADTRPKLSVAMDARDQMGNFEFYCDTTGDIIFKPPFYNLNVIPNKPVSWIQDFEIIDDSVSESEDQVITHITSSGNAFGGTTDMGINDEITTPRTGVYDLHLLRQYGWRRYDHSVEWAGNPVKLYFHLYDLMDRMNAKRSYGSVTIPLRPEIRMGFPIWFPKYDSFFYVSGVSHSYSAGGQATTNLTLTAKRSKFIAPKNIGRISTEKQPTQSIRDEQSVGGRASQKKVIKDQKNKTQAAKRYKIEFPGDIGETSTLQDDRQQEVIGGEAAIIRHPDTGQLLGYPNAVMTFRRSFDGENLPSLLRGMGRAARKNPGSKNKESPGKTNFNYRAVEQGVLDLIKNKDKTELISRLRLYRYEAGASNLGLYDYAHDKDKIFKEVGIIPANEISWGVGTLGGPDAGPSVTETLTNSSFRSKTGANAIAVKKKQEAIDRRIGQLNSDINKEGGLNSQIKTAKEKAAEELFAPLEAEWKAENQELRTRKEALGTANKKLEQLQKNQKKNGETLAEADATVNSDTEIFNRALSEHGEDDRITISARNNLDISLDAQSEARVASGETDEEITKTEATISDLEENVEDQEETLDDLRGSGVESVNQAIKTLTDQLIEKETELAELRSARLQTKVLPSLNIPVRPVSDEFGFEVIGHQRYGRGAFIDRGRTQIALNEGQSIANQLGIQFAATSVSGSGSLIDEVPDTNDAIAGPGLMDFVATFEKMSPTDYQTGALFTGGQYGNEDDVADINFTSQNTYDQDLVDSRGKTIFIEADATRRATTLGELKPTLSLPDGVSSAYANCECYLGKTQWLSVLPKAVIKRILESETSAVEATTDQSVDEEPEFTAEDLNNDRKNLAIVEDFLEFSEQAKERRGPDGQLLFTDEQLETSRDELIVRINDAERFLSSVEPVVGANSIKVSAAIAASAARYRATPTGFFEELNRFLLDKFSQDYRSNKEREEFDTKGGRQVFTTPPIQPGFNNVLPDPTGELFQRASLGDVDALKALQNDVNFNFGLTKEAAANFKGAKNEAVVQLEDAGTKLRKSIGQIGGPRISVSAESPRKILLEKKQTDLAGAKDRLSDAQEALRANPESTFLQQQVTDANAEVASLQSEVRTIKDAIVPPTEPETQGDHDQIIFDPELFDAAQNKGAARPVDSATQGSLVGELFVQERAPELQPPNKS